MGPLEEMFTVVDELQKAGVQLPGKEHPMNFNDHAKNVSDVVDVPLSELERVKEEARARLESAAKFARERDAAREEAERVKEERDRIHDAARERLASGRESLSDLGIALTAAEAALARLSSDDAVEVVYDVLSDMAGRRYPPSLYDQAQAALSALRVFLEAETPATREDER